MVTIYDVAKRANVSTMTVSRAINNSPLIKKETRLKVERAIEELDYIPNRSARSLISKDSKLLSLIITDITNPFFTNIARGAEDKANEQGYQVVFSNSDESLEKETAYIRSAIARRIDGVLLAPAGDASADNAKLLAKHEIPFVLIDRDIQGIESDLVMADNNDATRKLLAYLLGRGHRRIAFLSGPYHLSNTRERQSAFQDALRETGLEPDERFIVNTDLKMRQTDEIIHRFLVLTASDRPTAILATNNFLAVEAVKTLRNMGLSVPEDMTVVCFDDPDPIPDLNPFFTIVHQPAYDFGYTGMDLLIQRIEGKAPIEYRTVRLPSELMIRRT